MNFFIHKIKKTCEILDYYRKKRLYEIVDFEIADTDYKTNNNPPKKDRFRPFDTNTVISGCDKHFWLHTSFKTPDVAKGKSVFFELKTGHEGQWNAKNPQCIVYLNGEMTQALDVNHTEILLNSDTEYDMYIYLYTGTEELTLTINASIYEQNDLVNDFYYDLSVPFNAAACLDDKDENRDLIVRELEAAINIIDFRKPFSDEFFKSIKEAQKYLYSNFYNEVCGKSDAIVNCIGHTHIDVAWLWRVKQTVEKAQRSFATVIKLMDEFPEYKFMSSQPQLYKYVKREAPKLYEKIKEKVNEKRWEVEGAMWLEADCNLISGESMVRQILHGKEFMQTEFGVDSKCLWLPDVFGYSAAMPQILKKCGVDRFVTSKISWNETNKMPYDSFMWEGIDGTSIFTYFLTAQNYNKNKPDANYTTYNGQIKPEQVKGAWNRYQQKEYNNETIITFGYGDGGGGPTRDMLMQQRRLEYGIPGLPKTQISFAGDFLERAEKNFHINCERLNNTPKWVGELYLEFHRGTYTSIAKNKRNNRKSEIMYQNAEQLSVLDMLMLGGSYPSGDIKNSWETILLNQFHDIIPGSSIFDVYEDSDKDYKKIMELGNSIISEKLNKLAENIQTDGGTLVYNPTGFEADGIVSINGENVYVENIPPMGYKVCKCMPLTDNGVIVSEYKLENKYFTLEFDENYNIVSLYDKTNTKEVVKSDETFNQLRIFEDIPREYDAWEITDYYTRKMWEINDVSGVEYIHDNTMGGVKITRKYLDSYITQSIILYNNIDRIDFNTEIDWYEEHQLLKAFFPINVHAVEATYDIQFGNIKRPTHKNTSWDQAKFEVCAHKWADISDDGYGVSLINDCKYGHSASGSTLSLTLLKCATYPNPNADKGHHVFSYSICPHAGNFKTGETVKKAYLFNNPLITVSVQKQNGTLPESFSFVSTDSKNIVIETVKKAEKSDDIIVRFYDAFDRSEDVTLKFGKSINEAFLCDLLENNIKPIEVQDNTITVHVSNYEIMTLKISVK